MADKKNHTVIRFYGAVDFGFRSVLMRVHRACAWSDARLVSLALTISMDRKEICCRLM